MLLALPSCSQEVLVFFLFVVFLRWEPKAVVGAGQRSRSNKLVGRPLDLDLWA